ncbi:restriction endonuclease [Clostridium sp. SYSU_GA19001]|uniref:PmeII family type II restriction endonuclease n=1 Tax=Clostridium caldaquaticum TaxID=2940653 RepID=UPI0020771A54|nr:PmeII family type II restriction endonuclease [Clostridium caldaquaticum]MCM8709927.1 restriction endonuclease [Clostridium caldaquaticum]
MDEQQRYEILVKAKEFFKESVIESHKKNTIKCKKLSNFNINPFLVSYLSNYLTGNSNSESLARALIYPRILGTSITTTFGNNMQKFCSYVLGGFASTTSGIDIEFIDQVDGRKKYCQIKSGPNTINKDDVETINNHFKAVKNLARTNGLRVSVDDLVVGVFYGTEKQLSVHYKKVNETYPVIVGQDFWHRLTGNPKFYFELINAIGELAIEEDSSSLVENVIQELTKEIEEKGLF